MILKEAILHDTSNNFVYALNKNEFIIRIRVQKNNLNEVVFCYTDKDRYKKNITQMEFKKMYKLCSDNLFDYYELKYSTTYLVTKYFFKLISDDQELFYSQYVFYKEAPLEITSMFDISRPMKSLNTFESIDWLSNGIVYEIFPDRFCKYGEDFTERNLKDWYAMPKNFDHFGGNLKGIINKIDYLKDLGINIIYLTPIFLSPSNHKYNTTDYMHIDPDFGTDDDLRQLCDLLHKNNMKLILDAVFNHCGEDFFPFQDVLKNQENSKYADWFCINSFPITNRADNLPSYDSFHYYHSMPKFNTNNKEFRKYVENFINYWMNNFNIDGWRLDVADEVAPEFWRFFRNIVKKNKSDAPLIGEVWYEAQPWLLGDQFDSVMEYPFFSNLNNLLISKTILPSDFINSINHMQGTTHSSAFQMLWNLIDSHDCPRFLFAANENKKLLKLAVIIQMTMTGTPMIYYGDELGMTGGIDPDCRRGMVWDENRQDQEIFSFYKSVINIRNTYSSLRNGILKTIFVDDQKGVMIYEKFHNNQSVYVVINNGSNDYAHKLLEGKTDLITTKAFNGAIKAYSGGIFI